MHDTGIPIGITFAGKAYSDNDLLRYAYAYEKATQRRVTPPLTPALPSDKIIIQSPGISANPETEARTTLDISSVQVMPDDTETSQVRQIQTSGDIICVDEQASVKSLVISINGEPFVPIPVQRRTWTSKMAAYRAKAKLKYKTWAPVPMDKFVVILLAEMSHGTCAGRLLLID